MAGISVCLFATGLLCGGLVALMAQPVHIEPQEHLEAVDKPFLTREQKIETMQGGFFDITDSGGNCVIGGSNIPQEYL